MTGHWVIEGKQGLLSEEGYRDLIQVLDLGQNRIVEEEIECVFKIHRDVVDSLIEYVKA